MKKLENIKNELFGKDQTLNSNAMNIVLGGAVSKSKTKGIRVTDNDYQHGRVESNQIL